ncbi:hypothetical protein HDG37_005501 [Paraburkholderia sp. MM5384-R2]|uniref:Uncharacterized protein n=1 Tax=Paraburkholderia tuberum TaxID=157910 RepID=A0A1H1KIF1_9BURK|nr:hypothetical protein [Paraburkholderia sp. MM5384-R2]SDR61832.1 hypothetical protein SAMN05445850_7988 [Paraburkholderia tuberum]
MAAFGTTWDLAVDAGFVDRAYPRMPPVAITTLAWMLQTGDW